MDHHIVTMAGSGTDAEWFIEALLRYARTRNVLPYSQEVVATHTIDDAVRAISDRQPTAILSAVLPRKSSGYESLPRPVVEYLEFLRSHRGLAQPHLPLVLVGNYPTGLYSDEPGNGSYHSLEHAARLARPDVCVVERRYGGGAGFNFALERVAMLFSNGEAFKDRPLFLTTISKRVPDREKPLVSTAPYSPGLVTTMPYVVVRNLPACFRSDAAAETSTQTHQ